MTKKTKALAAAPTEATRTEGQRCAQLALRPSINAAVVMATYQGNIVDKEVDMAALTAPSTPLNHKGDKVTGRTVHTNPHAGNAKQTIRY